MINSQSLSIRSLRRTIGVFQAAINWFIDEHNQTEAKSFAWSADPDEIIAARNREFQTLKSIH